MRKGAIRRHQRNGYTFFLDSELETGQGQGSSYQICVSHVDEESR